jgi:carboxyl-terminal processing protease
MKRRLVYAVVTVLLAVNALVGAKLYLSTASAAESDDPYDSLRVFATVMERIRQEYVDGENLSYDDLVRGALKGMLNTLDPHSEYMEPRKYDDLRKDTEGEYGGVGIVVSVRTGRVTVVTPMEGTPGFEAGILAGDELLKVDGKDISRDLTDTVQLLRGKPNTKVTITIFRPSTGETRDVVMTRQVIKVSSVVDLNGMSDYKLLPGAVGYVRIAQFGDHTADDLEKALSRIEKQSATGLIIDLRDNPGGLLDQAVYVAEKFLPRNQLIVTTEGRGGVHKEEYRARGGGPVCTLPMVVLVNGGSASAAEIVSGCMQDVKRAVIVGEQTFGKGSVQSILPLGNGAALRLTTAKYYTPSHKVIHEHGITPDIAVPLEDEDKRLLDIRRSPGGLDSLPEAQRQKAAQVEDPQLDRALEVLKTHHLLSEFSGEHPRATVMAGKRHDRIAKE